ncbi:MULTISPECIES: GNAT family N-acetyltransferase [Asticcacaulis]|uniref:GNAT family N-acetyltransferase n=1 Tax=Asticcacaulis TaxID=76890 RepID=UPI001AEB567B|nr:MULTISPECIES: GNAT family N-acetyltransferase [Asticcacaulis]MBP2160725.1 putative N-acyltransferase [Asticcacaulis solisilvae]MDR6801770.1 putative N-acyltransferase [Asticcacaulis sp. BE141]
MTSPTLSLHDRISDIGEAAWDALLPDQNPFTTFAYLEALESTGCVGEESGWQPAHLALRDGDAVIGAMPLYIKYHSMGEYVFDHAWARAYEQAGGDYYPKLQSSIPFTPVTGPRLLAKDVATRQALLNAAMRVCDQNRLSSLHITFPLEEEWLSAGEQNMLLRQDQQFWFDNPGYGSFEDFLAALSSNRRKVIRRERRDVQAQLSFRLITGKDITETHLDEMYAFIRNTYDRKWGQPYLTRAFFSSVTERMRDRILLVFAYDGDQAVAGAINFIGGDILYGRQWGATVDVPFLHFEVCYYQAMDYAIAHGLRRVEAGTQGEHKLMRGYLPHPVYSAHYIRDARLRRPVADYLERERVAVVEQMELMEAEASPFKKGE